LHVLSQTTDFPIGFLCKAGLVRYSLNTAQSECRRTAGVIVGHAAEHHPMGKLRGVSTRRLAVLMLMSLVILFTACERPDGAGGGAAAAPFKLPEVDVSGLSEGLQGRLAELRAAVTKSPEDADQMGALGAIYYVHEFPEAAVACFTRARELSPETMHWWYYSGLAYERAAQPEQAIAAYERGLELDADYGPLYVRLAGLLVGSDRERAERLCQRALELNPDNATAMVTLGLCDEAAGDQAAALARFEQALKLVPNYKAAHEATARVLAAAGRTDEAEQHRAAAVRGITPRVDDRLLELLLRQGFHLETLLSDAVTFAERGLLEEADEPLARARLVDPGLRTQQAAGIVHALQDRLDEAAAEFRAVLAARPELLTVRARLADVLARQEKYPEAEAELRTVLEQAPDDAFALERLSRLLAVRNRWDEAEQLLREAAERQPEVPWIRFQLGGLLYDEQKNDEARAELLKCLELAPEHVRARYFLGLLARREGNMAEAVKYWQDAVERLPTFLEGHMALAESAVEARDFEAAERYLREGLKQAPDLAGLVNGLAWILATSPTDSQRNGEEAVRLAEKACKLTENREHGLLDTLAAAYAELGRFDDAVKTQQEAIKLAQEADNQESVKIYEERLKLYEQRQPFRDVE
jgi:tetratricopeptide (TPR) repeat protein